MDVQRISRETLSTALFGVSLVRRSGVVDHVSDFYHSAVVNAVEKDKKLLSLDTFLIKC